MLCAPKWGEEAHELGVSMRLVCHSSLRRRWNIVCPCEGKMPMSWVCRSLYDEDETMCTPVRGEGAHVMGLLFSSMQRVEMM
jgi:hypothetical protein